MPAISIGSVEVDVIPNASGILRRLQSSLIPPATQVGDEMGRIIGQRLAAHIGPAVRDGINNGAKQARPAATRQGADTGGAFARSLRAKLQEAFRSMPKLDVRIGDTGVDAELARLRARMETLSNKTIGIDVSAEQARAEAADIEERLRRLGAAHPNIAVRADTARAIAQLQAVQAQVDELTHDPARIRVETDGQLGTKLRAAVQQAQASLPNINIGADTSPAQVEIARLRAQLAQLSDKRVGIDISAGEAIAQITQIRTQLAHLSTQDADVAVRVDAGAASAQLAAFTAQVNRLDGRTARVHVDTRGAVAGMQMLVTAAIAFGPALLPALPVAAAGLGAIAAAGVAAGVGLASIGAVAVPAFKDIGGALQAQKAAQDAATSATNSGGAANGRAAQQAGQMASAQQALATAQRNAAQQIRDAERGVTDAVRQAAQANAQAAAQVKSARQSLADAYTQAADRMAQANEQVDQAERDLAQAQKSSRQAQLDLTAARAEASRQLQDMNNQLASSKLSERDAEIALTEATAQRDAVLKNANATELDKKKAILQYDQAVQRLKEQRLETQRLTTDTKAANKAGVEGSQTVKSAQEQLASAQQAVVDKTSALKKAQQSVAKTQLDNTRAIADAQTKLSEAQKNVAETQRQGADSIARAQERVVQAQQSAADSVASAQRQIASASQSAAGGIDQAAAAQAKYQAALAKMTPATRATFNAFVKLRSAFSDWSRSLQPDVMPIFTRALNGIRKALPSLTPFVKEAASAVKDLQDRFSNGVKSPWFQSLKKDLKGGIKPAIVGLGVAFGNVFKGMGGIIQAFLPHMDSISNRMQSITKRFANWGAGLKGSPEFERFLDYSAKMGPKLAQALGKIGGAFLSVGQALGPLSGALLTVLGGVAQAIGVIAEHAPWLIQGIWLLIVAMRVWTIVQWALNAAMSANPLVLIGLAIIALIAIVVYCYNRFGWFRDGVQAVWNAIKVASLWLWNTVLKPVFTWIGQIITWLWVKIVKPYISFIIAYWKKVAQVAMWLWKNVLSPVFKGIGNVISWWWKNIVQRYFGLVKTALGKLGDVFKWLYNKVIKPVWDKISSAISFVWQHGIKPTFDKLKSAVHKVADAFESARGFIKRAWDKLQDIAKKPVRFIINTVYNRGIVPVWNKVATAFGADPIKKMDISGWATGGVLPGYTPGKDVHKFYSPTGGGLELSGGEAIMRPEFTRAVGTNFVNTMNAAARSRGSEGVKAALAPMLGGSAPMSTDTSLKYANGGILPTQKFAGGGIFGWIGKAKNAIAGAGSAAWNKVKDVAGWLKDGLEASARAGVKHVVDPLLAKFPGASGEFGKMVRRIPDHIVDTLFGYAKSADKKGGGGGIGGPRIQAALKWAKSQSGKKYQWAGNGNPSWDCSGFMSAIESVIRGQKPHRRWATMAFSGKTAPPGWVYHGNSPFKIGITNKGVGHTAGTLAKTNVESSGGLGVHYGKSARGYNDSMFGSWYGFMPGKYDNGGMLQPGFNLAYNGTGRPEPVLTGRQFNQLAGSGGALGDLHVSVFVGDREITDIARTEVHNAQGELVRTLYAS